MSSTNAPEGAINTSFPGTPFGDAYAFGLRALQATVREQLPYILIVLAGAVALTLWSSNGKTFSSASSAQLGFLVMFPAIAVAGRLYDPAYRMNSSIVIGVIGIWAIFLFAISIAFCPVFVALIFKTYDLLWIYVAIVPVAIWVSVKLSFAPVIYALQPEGERNVLRAMIASWDHVAEDTWWRAVGLNICIGLSAELPGSIASGIAFAALRGISTPAAIVVAAALYYCANLAGSIWQFGAYVAMASGLPE